MLPDLQHGLSSGRAGHFRDLYHYPVNGQVFKFHTAEPHFMSNPDMADLRGSGTEKPGSGSIGSYHIGGDYE
jgi:hypothetical protein